MGSTAKSDQAGTTGPPQGKLTARVLKLHQWESYRGDIYDIYIRQNHTLQETMQLVKDRHDFAPSVRKFKEKLKEWNFEKYLSAEESRFVTAKRKTRAEEGKGTTFYKNGKEIDEKRIEKSFKRKWENADDPGPLIAATPQTISYSTPLPQIDGSEVTQTAQRTKRLVTEHHDFGASPTSNSMTGGEINLMADDLSLADKMNSWTVPEVLENEPDNNAANTVSTGKETWKVQRGPTSAGPEGVSESQRQEMEVSDEPPLRMVEDIPARFHAYSTFTIYSSEISPRSSRGSTPDSTMAWPLGWRQRAREPLTANAITELQASVEIGGDNNGNAAGSWQAFANDISAHLQPNNPSLSLVLIRARSDDEDAYFSSQGFLISGARLDKTVRGGNYMEARDIMSDMMTRFQSMKIEALLPSERTRVLFEAIRLAKGYYILRCFDRSESILSRVIAKCKSLDEHESGILRMHGYILKGCLLHRRESWEEAAKFFSVAKDCFLKTGLLDDVMETGVEVQLFKLSRRSRLMYEADEPFVELMEIEMGLGISTQASYLETVNLFREKEKNDAYGDSATEITSSSSRRGLTFPGSTSTGGGISEFLFS